MLFTVLIATVFVIAFIAEMMLFSFERYGWSLFCLIGNVVLAYFFIPAVEEFFKNTDATSLTIYGFEYLGAGIAVACVKWVFYVKKIAEKIAEWRIKFNKRVQEAVEPAANGAKREQVPNTPSAFANFVAHEYNDFNYKFNGLSSGVNDNETLTTFLTPNAKNYIDKITFWVFQWPIVILDLLLYDILAKIGKHISTLINAIFNKVSRILVKNAHGEF